VRRLPASLLALLAPAWVAAYRPFDGTDASVAEAGEAEIELGPAGFVAAGDARIVVAPALIANLGVFHRAELVLEGRGEWPIGPDLTRPRLGETALSLKYVLREGGLQGLEGMSVAVEAGALLPTWRGEGGVGASVNFIASQRFGFGTLHLDVNPLLSRASHAQFIAGAIAEGPEGLRLRPVAEFQAMGDGPSPLTLSALAGVIVTARDGLTFDAAIRVARAPEAMALEVRAGLTFAFGVWR
jgi:hypothetical protein